MRRTADDAAETRARIVEAALAVFSEQGFRAAKLGDIGHAAGVTRGAIYHHFTDKAGLYAAILDEAQTSQGRVLQQAIAAGGTWAEVCRRVFVALHTAMADDPRLRAAAALALRETHDIPELAALRARQRDAGRRLSESVAGMMRVGAGEGAVRGDVDPVHLARAFLALSQGLIHLWLADPEDVPLATTSAALADILFTGIGAQP